MSLASSLLLSVHACENATLKVNCSSPGHTIVVARANLGRFSVAVCNDEGRTDLQVNCRAPNTLHVLKKRWANLKSC